MLSSILSFLSSAFGVVSKVIGYLDKKNLENQIKNNYEKQKEIDALQEDKVAKEKVEESNSDVKKAKESVRVVAKAKKEDADLTDDEITKEILSIVDPEEREQRSAQIQKAKEIKAEADKKVAEVEKDEKFNSGEEFTFKG